jgi:beta-propeller repeat-containing protein
MNCARAAFLGILCFALLPLGAPRKSDAPVAPSSRKVPDSPFQREFAFVPNLGQWSSPVAFVASQKDAAVYVDKDSFSIRIGREEDDRSVSMKLVDAKPSATIVGEDPRAETFNYFLGRDPSGWRTNVGAYSSVRYVGVYDGIDVKLRSHGSGLEYDLVLAPNASLDGVAIEAEGADELRLADDGSLLVKVGDAEVRQKPPRTWQETADGRSVLVASAVTLLGGNRFGLVVPDRDPALRTVIDPGLEWSTYIGGIGRDEVKTMMLDSAGDVFVAGVTESGDFPVTPNAYKRTHSAPHGCYPYSTCGDGFVSKFSADGQRLIWSTFFGGTNIGGNDAVRAIAFDPNGDIVLGGNTTSGDYFPIFPNPGAYKTQSVIGVGQSQPFVSKISRTGSSLLYSTFFSGTRAGDRLNALAVDSQGRVVIGGTTIGGLPVYPNPGAFQTQLNCSSQAHGPLTMDATGGTGGGGNNNSIGVGQPSNSGCGGDSFIARLALNAQGTNDLTYCTYLGGVNYDQLTALVVNRDDSVIAVGYTNSCDFPTTPGAFSEHELSPDLCPAPLMDAFVTRLQFQGGGRSDMMYSTYFGGYDNDFAYAVTLASPGVVAITGATFSWDLPSTPGCFAGNITNLAGLEPDAFAVVLDTTPGVPRTAQVNYCTYLGGDLVDSGQAIAVDPLDGSMLIAGFTSSPNFPTVGNPFQPNFVGGPTTPQDVFVSRITPRGQGDSDLNYSTYLGGQGWDNPNAIAFEASNDVIVAGFTATGATTVNDFPLQNAFDPTYGSNIVSSNNRDGFITKLQLPVPVAVAIEPVSGDVAPGEVLSYDLVVTNFSSEFQSLFFQVDAYGPDGSPYAGNPIDRPQVVDLLAHDSQRFNLHHRIPATTRAPSGPYTLRGRLLPSTPGPTQAVGNYSFRIH